MKDTKCPEVATYFAGKTIDQKAKGGVAHCGPSDVFVCGAAFAVGKFNHTHLAGRPNT